MSTKRSAGPGVPTQKTPRSAASRKKDRSTNLCAFTFADGRQCRTPRCSGHLHLCYFHAQKEAESLAAQQVGKDIARFLPVKLLTACDLGAAMARLFCAVAQGQIKPKVASTLGYLAQTMLQSVPIAKHEYINAFTTDTWRSAVRFSFKYDDPDDANDADDTADTRAPQPAPQPPASASAPPTPVEAGLQPGSSASSSSTSSPAPQPSAQPAPSPHTPLPPTSTEFAQQLLAGRNSSRSEIPTQSGTGRETGGSPGFSSSPARSSDSTPARTSSTQPAPSSPCTLPTQPAPTPPAPQSTSPQQSQPTQNSQNNSLPAPAPPALPPVPPGFGAPANWDVLIPPKPRRRFSRLWQSRE